MGVRVFSRLKERMSLNEACVCVCVCPPKCVCASARMGAEMPRKAFECQRQRSRGNWREVTWKRQIKNSWLLLSNISPPFWFLCESFETRALLVVAWCRECLT